MKLSVIVPVYNVHQWLRHCLQSLLEQELDDYEVILVNDASRDNSQGICSEWCSQYPQFRLINHRQNLGLSAARNTGIDAACGEYITFVDSDDFLAPGTLSYALDDIGDADVLEYPVRIDHLARNAYDWRPEKRDIDFRTWMTDRGQSHCYACNKVFRRTLWNTICFPQGKYFEDILTIPHVLGKAGVIRMSDRGLYYYCARTGSISKSVRPRVLQDYVIANEKLLLLPENACNHELKLRYLNALQTCRKYHVEAPQNIRVHLPLSLMLTPGLSWRDRIKVLYYRLIRR